MSEPGAGFRRPREQEGDGDGWGLQGGTTTCRTRRTWTLRYELVQEVGAHSILDIFSVVGPDDTRAIHFWGHSGD